MHLLFGITKNAAKLRVHSMHFKVQKRNLFGILNYIFNRVSEDRIKQVGSDRACAEWLMRNGAFVKWVGEKDFLTHYNNLPLDPNVTGLYNIAEVKAEEAAISHYGFPHFVGCEHIFKMEFHKCFYFDDRCIEQLDVLKNSLTFLKITKCAEVTDKGLHYIYNLRNLQHFIVGELQGVKDIEHCVKELKANLPDCTIELTHSAFKSDGLTDSTSNDDKNK